MKPTRLLAAFLALVLLAPGVLSAIQGCSTAGCAVPAPVHDCCPQPAARLQASCCEPGSQTAGTVPKAPEAARADAGAVAETLAAAPSAPPVAVAPRGPSAALSPPLDPLARICVLRI
jgi:hypothetical protein